MTETARLRLRLLGRLVAEVDGEAPRIVEISGRLRRALLAYLAMQPGFAETRERLAALLWGESLDRQARQNLRQCLLDLRREFEPHDPFKIDRETIALHPHLIAVDAREFLALCQSDDLAELERAMSLYAGPFLDGLDFDSGTFHDWVRNERARFESAAAVAFEKYALRQDEARNGPQAIRAAERLVALDPLREGAQRLLMRILAHHSGRDAALAQASALMATLRAELDAAPELETAALIEEIRRSPIMPVSPVTVRLQAAARAKPDTNAVVLSGAASRSEVVPPVSQPAIHAVIAVPRTTASRRVPRLALVGWLTTGAAAAILGAIVLTLLTRDRVPPSPPSNGPVATPSVTEQVAGDSAWRSPGIVAGIAADKAALATSGVHPIVVLPFTAETADRKEEKVLADRITDDLINDLSRVPAFRVIARQTSRLYAGRPVDVAAVGAELGVRYVVEGSVRLQDERLRINVALIDPTTRLQVWSDRFERDLADRFTAQDDILRSIARHLHVSVMTAEDGRRGAPRAGDPAIDELLAKGWNGILRIFELGTTSGADDYFEEVLRRQPNNASAMLGLAGYKVGTVGTFAVPEREPYLTQADELLTRYFEINPRSSLANYYRGVLHKMRGEPAEALAAFRKVLEINPSFPLAYANVGHVLSRMGRLDEAIEQVRYAIKLSPKDPNVGNWSVYAGEIELERGRDDAALEWLKRAVELHPRGVFNHAALAAALALRGDQAGAAKHAARARDIAPWLTLDVMLERLTSTATKGSEPHRLIEGLRQAFANAG